MRNHIFITIITILSILTYSCTQETIELSTNNFKKTKKDGVSLSKIISELNNVKDSEVSEYFDDLIFHTGVGFQALIEDEPNLNSDLLSMLADNNHVSLFEFVSADKKIKRKLNVEIRNSLIENHVYKSVRNERINESIANYKYFDFVDLFNTLISEKLKNEQLIFFIPDNLEKKEYNEGYHLGIDVALPDRDLAIIFGEDGINTITEFDANQLNRSLVFVGINKIEKTSFKSGKAMHDEIIDEKLKKWYHYGKVTRQPCTQDCDIDYEWHRKRRWHTSWKLSETGTLVSDNEYDIYYHSNYRIRIIVEYTGQSNLDIHEKHWEDDNWQIVNF